MYADPKRIRRNRVPVYLDTYVYERLVRLVEMTGGETSVVSRGALERGLDVIEQELHGGQCLHASTQKRDVLQGHVCA
ncbi:hypothetical protein [Acidovorax sp. MR-S7]|uniref:hypothetical protein n=1 Tax=Acidovorax sp. MR-S7 TaxID=1268622 RepID=UPI00035E1CF7|nr:hypothetical protein [Acidovorax sp. MR-S7]GAD20927.1 DNA polymerase elongation subunit [Acidovorax sp. MR-S7]